MEKSKLYNSKTQEEGDELRFTSIVQKELARKNTQQALSKQNKFGLFLHSLQHSFFSVCFSCRWLLLLVTHTH
jgi:hypothetical protein